MICYKGNINGEEIIFKVEDKSSTITVIEFDENDEQIMTLYHNQIYTQELLSLKRKLFETDYIACKIAEGAATQEEYAFELEERREWRKKINELEAQLQ